MPDSLNSILDTVLAKGPGLSVILLAIASIIVWYRSGSTFLLLRLLLTRVMGVKADASSPLGRFSNEQEQLLAYRIKTGMRCVRTTKHAQQIIKWAKDNDVNVEAVVGCGTYFNYKKVALNENLPRKWVAPMMLFFAMIFLALASIVIPFIFLDAAVAQSNETSHWFYLRKTEFNAFDGKRVPISECQDTSTLPEKIGISKRDVEIICKFVADPKYPGFVDSAIRDQRTLLPIPLTLLVAMFTMFYRFGKQILNAWDLRGLVKARPGAAPKRKPVARVRAVTKTPKAPGQPTRRSKKPAVAP